MPPLVTVGARCWSSAGGVGVAVVVDALVVVVSDAAAGRGCRSSPFIRWFMLVSFSTHACSALVLVVVVGNHFHSSFIADPGRQGVVLPCLLAALSAVVEFAVGVAVGQTAILLHLLYLQ